MTTLLAGGAFDALRADAVRDHEALCGAYERPKETTLGEQTAGLNVLTIAAIGQPDADALKYRYE
ncbi:hypothetical protein LRE75_09395 [Streptomyces sp. 372A]|uniref:hypothetical protein n=1 Tax=Streptomyces sp. SAS_281 TaxID=3412744 RepID=UPI00403CFF91